MPEVSPAAGPDLGATPDNIVGPVFVSNKRAAEGAGEHAETARAIAFWGTNTYIALGRFFCWILLLLLLLLHLKPAKKVNPIEI